MAYEKIASFHSAEEFRAFLESKGYEIPIRTDLSGELKLAEKVRHRAS